MPTRRSADLDYHLVLLDRDGAERSEADGTKLSHALSDLAAEGVTDIFLASHGWQGDIPAAIAQYDAWTAVMTTQEVDRDAARAAVPEFTPLVIGVHWPSLPWGKEEVAQAVLGETDDPLVAERALSDAEIVDRYAARLNNSSTSRACLTEIIALADDPRIGSALLAGTLPDRLDSAYQALFHESGLATAGAHAPPGDDQDRFAPLAITEAWDTELSGGSVDIPGLLGSGTAASVRDLVLAPVRQLSFWAMKHRARLVGERGVHDMVRVLQERAPDARIHLMGHSFGCIVVTAAVAGPQRHGGFPHRLPRPVETLFLVQGAMSLWSFAEQIPFAEHPCGFYRPLCCDPRAVAGPIVVTHSAHDRALGTFFPLGAGFGAELTLGYEHLPQFGATGTYGAHGAEPTVAHRILDSTAQYRFEPGTLYNIEADAVIRHGAGPAGAHSDIAHPEVAHLFWQAALASMV
ncbi:hypothetical protein [Nocardia salmonicida]|uniref:hypothetical protein n=1 Tax=Nocardia salmonicida TaxID=53431 RepID=UPI0037A463D7